MATLKFKNLTYSAAKLQYSGIINLFYFYLLFNNFLKNIIRSIVLKWVLKLKKFIKDFKNYENFFITGILKKFKKFNIWQIVI